MSFHLYDSRTRRVTEFNPVIPGQASIYHCGLTVQSAPHLGHIRKEVVFDVLRRWLTHEGYAVTVIANVTDIDDKILAKSAQAGVPWYALAYGFERDLHEAYRALGCLPPTYEPRATGHVPEMIEMISTLVERGHAYAAEDRSGDVYFDVASWPSYGTLSNQQIADMEAAEDADPRGKRDPRDFALWKGWKSTEPSTASWAAPWGRGRPGWHIECSAMAGKYLGDEFDIHGGGLDLRFPHHENELAQSTAAGEKFARYWMHNAMLTQAGEKMSKSLGNGALVSEVIKHHPARAVRFYLVSAHYRSVLEFSSASLVEATASLARIDSFVDRAAAIADDPLASQPESATPEAGPLPVAFVEAMDDDLSTPAAVAVIYASVREGNQAVDRGDHAAVGARLGEVRAMLDVLGLRADDPAWADPGGSELEPVVDGLIRALLEQRTQARARRDYAAADAVRDILTGLGIKIEDTPSGPRWSLAGGNN